MDYSSTVFGFPFPNTVYEGVTAEFVPVETLRCELLFYDILCRYTGVVGSGEPKNSVSRHTFPARKDILHHSVEGVTHMERAGDVRRGDD